MNATCTATQKPLAFSLRFLFLVTTFTAVCCTMVAALPSFGPFFAVLATAAFVRTCVTARRSEPGRFNSRREPVVIFANTLAGITLMVFLACWVVPIFIVSLVVAIIVVSGMMTVGAQVVTLAIAIVTLVFLAKAAIGIARAIWQFICCR